jgi:hypothetical protein
MALNGGRVIGGGLAAGVVLGVVDFVTNGVLLKDRMATEMNSVAAGLSDRMMTGSAAVGFILSDFIIGILLVWLYAMIRERYGAGPRSAVMAAIFMWIAGSVFYYPWTVLGLMTMGTYVVGAIVQLVSLLIAAWVGGMIYKEAVNPS